MAVVLREAEVLAPGEGTIVPLPEAHNGLQSPQWPGRQ